MHAFYKQKIIKCSFPVLKIWIIVPATYFDLEFASYKWYHLKNSVEDLKAFPAGS
jgi:hypothetical protein